MITVAQAPVGYLKTSDQRYEKDPDKRVKHAVLLVFDKFFELGSARQTLLWFLDQGLELPARQMGSMGWETVWKRPVYQTIKHILLNPIYAGAYVHGKTSVQTQIRDGQIKKVIVKRTMDEWPVLILDHHDGYISWETFQRIKRMISDNAQNKDSSSHGAPKKGPALLGGLLRCRRCARTMMVQYTGTNRGVPRYNCCRGNVDNGEPRCISIGGIGVDEAVSSAVLHVVQPSAIKAAVMAAEEEVKNTDGAIEVLMLELKAARYAAERAHKQYDTVDPGNRLVADELEHRWESALKKVRELEERIEREKMLRNKQVKVDVDSLIGLADDLEMVWNDPQTDVRLKKRIIRTLIEEIIVDIDTSANEIELIIHWKGGVHSQLRVPRRRKGYKSTNTSKDIVEAVRQLALICTDDVIACFLSRNGLKTGRGNRFTRQRVMSLCKKHGIRKYKGVEGEEKEWMNLNEASAYAGVAPRTLFRAVQQGDVRAIHPLADGPWVFNRQWLDFPRAQEAFQRAKAHRQVPSVPCAKQQNLMISDR